MKPPDLSQEEAKLRAFYKLVAIVSFVIMAATTLYGVLETLTGYLTSGVVTVGETLVFIDWPLPYLAKPVTYLSFSTVAFMYAVTNLYRRGISRLSPFTRGVLKFMALIVAFGSLYEVIYNFMAWGSLFTTGAFRGQINPDFLNIPYPDPTIPWNLVFATKMFLALFIISSYSFFFLHRLEEQRAQSR